MEGVKRVEDEGKKRESREGGRREGEKESRREDETRGEDGMRIREWGYRAEEEDRRGGEKGRR